MEPLFALTTGQAQVVSAGALIVVSGLAALSALGVHREALASGQKFSVVLRPKP